MLTQGQLVTTRSSVTTVSRVLRSRTQTRLGSPAPTLPMSIGFGLISSGKNGSPRERRASTLGGRTFGVDRPKATNANAHANGERSRHGALMRHGHARTKMKTRIHRWGLDRGRSVPNIRIQLSATSPRVKAPVSTFIFKPVSTNAMAKFRRP
jgi:hypothetical protein